MNPEFLLYDYFSRHKAQAFGATVMQNNFSLGIALIHVTSRNREVAHRDLIYHILSSYCPKIFDGFTPVA